MRGQFNEPPGGMWGGRCENKGGGTCGNVKVQGVNRIPGTQTYKKKKKNRQSAKKGRLKDKKIVTRVQFLKVKKAGSVDKKPVKD